ncbi:MAG TPA: adenosine kinase [Paracoccaceae bacterium]|nr:adenosine kinase [Paracoccaceae bacterium]
MTKNFQVVGIGNAIVDVLSRVEEDFLTRLGVQKSVMQLITAERAIELYDNMGPAKEISGGSAANTIAGIAALGMRTAYVGKVKDDQLGAIFAHDIRAQGAVYETPKAPKTAAAETGRCMVLVTPDSERSMNTYLGVSEHLTADDIDTAIMADTDWLYLEGYRFDGPESHAAFAKAISACKSAGGKVSITLSDPFCVERHRDAFLSMIRADVDLLFCNEHELKSLYETDDLGIAMALVTKDVDITACTVGEKGAYVLQGEDEFYAPAEKTHVVDVTGAGDLFAAGFLYGLAHERDLGHCAQLGNIAAAEVISHIGARPEANLLELFAAQSL